jgi:hypothetical protein
MFLFACPAPDIILGLGWFDPIKTEALIPSVIIYDGPVYAMISPLNK